MVAKQPTKPDQVPEENFKVRLAKINAILSGWQAFVKWGGIALIARYGFLSIDSLAGESTNSNIMLQLVTDLKANQWFPYVFGGAGFMYGLGQRKEKKKTITRLHSRVKELEQKIDPDRTSSGLTETGDTRPEDEI